MEQHLASFSASRRCSDSCDSRLAPIGSHLHSQLGVRRISVLTAIWSIASFAFGFVSPTVQAATIFESGMLGPTGVSGAAVFISQIVPGSNVGFGLFQGARFEIGTPVEVTHIGGHFVLDPAVSANDFFGALVRLDSGVDFPDSSDLSTADVIAVATLHFPEDSSNVLGRIDASIGPGWYSVVFGSGLFGTSGSGGALRNNTANGSRDHITFHSGAGWGNAHSDLHFTVLGEIIPEPSGLVLLIWSAICVSQRSSRPANAPVGLDRM